MNRFTIQREVIETIEVDADTADEALEGACEMPIATWTRDIKSEEVVSASLLNGNLKITQV